MRHSPHAAKAPCTRLAAGMLAVLTALWQAAAAQPASAPAAAPARAALSAEECVVWRRELSFARSVEAHDAAAFAAHVHPGAVFNAGSAEPLRGREAVLVAWAGLIDGKLTQLRWRPGTVNIGGDPNIALSRGPYMLEGTGRDGTKRRSVGFFHSVWVREAGSSEWRILFDGPDGVPGSIDSEAAARQFMAAQSPEECPLR